MEKGKVNIQLLFYENVMLFWKTTKCGVSSVCVDTMVCIYFDVIRELVLLFIILAGYLKILLSSETLELS